MDSLISVVEHVLGHLTSGLSRKLWSYWRSSQKTWPYLRRSPPSRKRSSRPTSLRKRNHAERNAWFPEIISHAHNRKSMTLRAFTLFVIKELPTMLPSEIVILTSCASEKETRTHSEDVKIFYIPSKDIWTLISYHTLITTNCNDTRHSLNSAHENETTKEAVIKRSPCGIKAVNFGHADIFWVRIRTCGIKTSSTGTSRRYLMPKKEIQTRLV